ncbi:hypothetical protein DOT_5048 [Desulfosporosinus sp. OT]|nr:hypothetical protein DOT_5048 [Desulfosporosinus sp. OT]
MQKLCKEDRIKGDIRFCHVWEIPMDTEMPVDGRLKSKI